MLLFSRIEPSDKRGSVLGKLHKTKQRKQRDEVKEAKR